MSFLAVINETRNNFGEPPRKFKFWEKMHLHIRPPEWVRLIQDTRFLALYEQQDLLYREGIIVWGHIIQANELLFEKGKRDHPAAIVYSLERIVDREPEILARVARFLFSIKGKETDQELQEFSEKLAGEIVADWKLPVPLSLAGGVQCFYITTMVVRKHLPKKILSGSLFPFLVCPAKTDVGMILPARYWPERFKRKLW
jgi:hypothetical protein